MSNKPCHIKQSQNPKGPLILHVLNMVKNIDEKYNTKLKFIINVNEQDQNDSCSCFNILTQTW